WGSWKPAHSRTAAPPGAGRCRMCGAIRRQSTCKLAGPVIWCKGTGWCWIEGYVQAKRQPADAILTNHIWANAPLSSGGPSHAPPTYCAGRDHRGLRHRLALVARREAGPESIGDKAAECDWRDSSALVAGRKHNRILLPGRNLDRPAHRRDDDAADAERRIR